jgi:hypothetical protein
VVLLCSIWAKRGRESVNKPVNSMGVTTFIRRKILKCVLACT